jgi:hypothetical protein
MRRKLRVVVILTMLFVISQLYGFYETDEVKQIHDQTTHTKFEWKFKQEDENIQPQPVATTIAPTNTVTFIPTHDSETEIEPTWHLFDLPYPSPPVRRNEGHTITTHIPIADDKLLASFTSKYKKYHDNMFTGRKRLRVTINS